MMFLHSHKHTKFAAPEENTIFITVDPVESRTPSPPASTTHYQWENSSASSSSSSGSSRSSLSPNSAHSSPNSSPASSPKMSPRRLFLHHHREAPLLSLAQSQSQSPFSRSQSGSSSSSRPHLDPATIEANEWSSLVIDTVQATLSSIEDALHRLAYLSPLDKRQAWFRNLHADLSALKHLLYVADPTQEGSNSNSATVRDVVQWIGDCQPLMQRITIAVGAEEVQGRLEAEHEAQDLRTRFYVCRVRSSNVITQGEALANSAAMRMQFPNLTWKEISRGGRS